MALTTARAFDDFKAKVVLTDAQNATVTSRCSTTDRYLSERQR
jgi:hypothetical protein